MGIVRMGPPEQLVQKLAQEFMIPTFIETGTYYGQTAVWAARHFEDVFTIEYAQELHTRVSRQFAHISNIKFLFGDSRVELVALTKYLNGKSLLWLDAHWSGDMTYGAQDECPILDELKILNQATGDLFIFIDDARLFMAPPPLPHRIEQWPDITTIILMLQSGNSIRYVVILEDVIIAVPEYAKAMVAAYCQKETTNAWEAYGRQLRTSNFHKGYQLIVQDMKQRGKMFCKKIWRKKCL